MYRIVFVTNKLCGGGSERVLTILANNFASRGYDVTIISFQSGERYSIFKEVKVQELNIPSRVSRIKELRKRIMRIDPQTVIAFEYFVNMQTILSCVGMKRQVIVSERNDPKYRGGHFPMALLRNVLYRYCDVLVCQTFQAKAYFPKAIQNHSIVIPNPLESAKLPDIYEGKRKKIVVSAGRFEEQKNFPLLIRAFARFYSSHPDYQLVIYGEGRMRKEMELIAAKLLPEGSWRFPGRVDNLPQQLGKCEIFALASDFEGIPNVLIEAMAMGTPSISTDCAPGGAASLICDGENGILVPVGDEKALADGLIQLADNPGFSASIGRKAAAIRTELDVDKIAALWLDCLKNR